MDYIKLRKRNIIKRYHDSDIFNLKTDSKLNKSTNPLKHRTTQESLEKTKDDLFNTLNSSKPRIIKPLKKKVYIQNYLNTDLFNEHLNDSGKKKKMNKRVNVNASSCFKGVLNNEEYKKELNDYTKVHRSKKKDYDVDKYFNKISAIGRYYAELYGDEKNGIFTQNKNLTSKTLANSPNKNGMNSIFQKNLKDFESRKKRLKIELKSNNEFSVDGKKKLDLTGIKETKGFYNKKKIDIFGQYIDIKNNRNIIKEKDGIKYNSKLHKQLQYQSDIFGEENKDINSKMNKYIKNEKEEKENKIKLKEKIKKANEEKANKINGQNKKKSCLNKNMWGGSHCKWQKSNMDWKDPGAQVLFQRTYTSDNLKNGETEMTAFQRKLYDMADSDNIDTLSEKKKFLNIDKYKNKTISNFEENNVEQTKEILNTMPNNILRTDQMIKIINGSTTSKVLNDSSNENISKMCKRINNNIKSERLSKSKKKKSNYIKIMGKNSNASNKNHIINNINNKKEYQDYLLVYSTKTINNFDNLNPNEIKKIFGAKGIHIFDIKKNDLDFGKINKIKFKIREGEEDNIKDLEQKIKMLEIDLNNKKYNVSIKKDDNIPKRKINKNKENTSNEANKNMVLKRKPKLISNFPIVDLKYKRLVQK